MVLKAISLERLTRQAVLALVWLATQDAVARNEEWLEAASAAMAPTEDELASITRRVRRRLRDFLGDEPFHGVDAEDTVSVKPEGTAARIGDRVCSPTSRSLWFDPLQRQALAAAVPLRHGLIVSDRARSSSQR